jgi:hypothetical protein
MEGSDCARRSFTTALGALWVVLACVYALSTGGHTYSPDEEGILLASQALAHGHFTIPVDETNDLVTSHRIVDGRAVAISGMGTSVLALPGYAVGRALAHLTPDHTDEQVIRLAMMWTNALVTATTAVVLVLLACALGASRRGAMLLGIAYGVGTMAWPSAKTLFSEPSTALFTTLAVLFAVRAVREHVSRLAAWSGAAVGVAVLCRPSAALFVVPVMVYLALAGRADGRANVRGRLISFAIGGIAPLTVFLATNWARFGSPFDAGYEKISQQGSLLQGMAGQLFSPGKSLFVYAPVAIVAVAGAWKGVRERRPETALLGSMIVLNLGFFARAPFWSGDNAWGPRYVGCVLPLVVALAAPVVDAAPWRRVAVATVAAGALLPGLFGTLVFFNSYFAKVNAEVGREPVAWAQDMPNFLVVTWWEPRWQPIAGHASLVPMSLRDTFDGRRATDPVRPPFPETMNQRFNWYDWPPRVDLWPVWLGPTGMPGWLALFVVPLLVGMVGGVQVLVRWWRCDARDGELRAAGVLKGS